MFKDSSNHFMNATGSITTTSGANQLGTVNSASALIQAADQRIQDLTTKKLALNSQLTEQNNKLSQAQASRSGCKGALGLWNNKCLDNNNAAQTAARTQIAALTAQIAAIDSDIKNAQADRTAAVADYEKAQAAQAQSDPEVAKVNANAAAQVEESKTKTTIYAAAAVVICLILGVVMVFVMKKP